jgi:peptidoglycan hydrolase-like protein with peptidoglycan-binding domain
MAAVLALGGAASANDDKNKPQETGAELEQQSGSEQAVDLKKIHGEHAKHLQQSLKDQGFYEGQVDGILGARTKEALRKFQESKGLDASGKLDNQTASALGIEFSDIQPVRGTEPVQPATSPTPGGMENQPTVSPTPMIEGGATTTPDTDVDTQAGTPDPMTSPTPSTDVDTQAGTPEPMTSPTPSDPNDTNVDPQSGDVDTQSGDSTSTVTGGDTETHETEPTSGDRLGGEPTMGGVEGQEDPNVVNETEIEPQAGTQTTFDKQTIRKVEQALKEKNLFKGKVDGVIDTQTTEAIRRFQTDNGMTVTGQLDSRVIQALGVTTGATDPMASPTPQTNETPAPTPMDPGMNPR